MTIQRWVEDKDGVAVLHEDTCPDAIAEFEHWYFMQMGRNYLWRKERPLPIEYLSPHTDRTPLLASERARLYPMTMRLHKLEEELAKLRGFVSYLNNPTIGEAEILAHLGIDEEVLELERLALLGAAGKIREREAAEAQREKDAKAKDDAKLARDFGERERE